MRNCNNRTFITGQRFFHGISGGNTVNNYALVNFDKGVVGPSSSGTLSYQTFGPGTFHGTCYLKCHGKDHNPLSY